MIPPVQPDVSSEVCTRTFNSGRLNILSSSSTYIREVSKPRKTRCLDLVPYNYNLSLTANLRSETLALCAAPSLRTL